MSTFDAVMIIEAEDTDRETFIDAFQVLINDGIVWRFQGWYGRTASNLISEGYCYSVTKEN